MNANYIYDIFKTTEERQAPDLNIGLAMLQESKPIPEGMADRDIRAFMGRHYEKLVAAYRAKDREAFAVTVAKCEEKDAEKVEE